MFCYETLLAHSHLSTHKNGKKCLNYRKQTRDLKNSVTFISYLFAFGDFYCNVVKRKHRGLVVVY